MQAADEVCAGRHDAEFPLVVWQSKDRLVHGNDDVNRGQSSTDVVPTAMNVAAVLALSRDLLPALRRLAETLEAKAQQFAAIVKIGRTHLQDATPLTLGQEVSGWAHGADQSDAAWLRTPGRVGS